jgi:hypothetical protein
MHCKKQAHQRDTYLKYTGDEASNFTGRSGCAQRIGLAVRPFLVYRQEKTPQNVPCGTFKKKDTRKKHEKRQKSRRITVQK